MSKKPSSTPSPTGIHGLDKILAGGLPRNRFYLITGDPGAGKTTVALQYLLAGAAAGEKGMYITLSETADEIRAVADSHGWDLAPLAIFELSALEHQLALEAQNTVFQPSEIELNQTTELLLNRIKQVKPRRLVIDSLSELRLLSDSPLRYRRQMLSLKQLFAGRDVTVLDAVYHVVEHFSMHTGQIILLTKRYAPGRVQFYEDAGGEAIPRF